MKHVVSSALLLGLSSLSLAAQAAPIALDLPAQPLAASLEQLQGASGLRIRFDRAAVADRRARPYAASWSQARHCSVCSQVPD